MSAEPAVTVGQGVREDGSAGVVLFLASGEPSEPLDYDQAIDLAGHIMLQAILTRRERPS